MVALPHVHWTDGVRLDLEAIGRRAREVGAALVVDGTQSVGAMPFNVTSIQPDAVICAAYKWLTGPYSIGLAYYGQRYDDGVPSEETWIGRLGSEDFRRLVDYEDAYRPGAARYDVGECSNFVLIPMLIAAALRDEGDESDARQKGRDQEQHDRRRGTPYCREVAASLTKGVRDPFVHRVDHSRAGTALTALQMTAEISVIASSPPMGPYVRKNSASSLPVHTHPR